MITHKLEWRIERAVVNMDDIDSDATALRIKECVGLIQRGPTTQALRHLPPLRFEWDWDNAERDARQHFAGPENFKVALTPENSTVTLDVESGRLVLSVAVFFRLTTLTDISDAQVSDIIQDKGLVYCGYVSGGWSYIHDSGLKLRIAPRT